MTDHEGLTVAQDLLADLAADLDDVRELLVPGGSRALVAELSMLHPAAIIHWLPVDARDLPAPEGRIVVHDNIGDPAIASGTIDLAVIETTGDRDLARRWITLARSAARPDGIVLLAGANDAGIKSVIGDAREAIGPSLVEDYRGRSRVAHIPMPEVPPEAPAWTAEPGIATGSWARFLVEEGGLQFPFETLPGVFSADRLDEGTRLLLANLQVPMGASVLDVGCGSGVMGVVAGRRGAGLVTMTDVSLLATAAARRNARLTEAPIEVIAGDVYTGIGRRRFDLIVSNPPFHRGKTVDYDVPRRLIGEARDYLESGGRLVIVANAFLPYDRVMREQFRKVEVVASTRQFRVLAAGIPSSSK